MQLVTSVNASATHAGLWFNCTKAELEELFGAKAIKALIATIKNGQTSANNLSMQTTKGSEQHADISLNQDYPDWVAMGKPESSLSFNLIKFELKPM